MEIPDMAPSSMPIGRLKCVQFSILGEEHIVRVFYFFSSFERATATKREDAARSFYPVPPSRPYSLSPPPLPSIHV